MNAPIPRDIDPSQLRHVLGRLCGAGLGELTLDEARRLVVDGGPRPTTWW